MIKKVLLSSLIILSIILVPSCETDVDINAEWEEITIVYGLLNQLDTNHYFRINKAYLGGNAMEIAKIEDSSSYKGALQVVLEGFENGEVVQSIPMDTTTISNKEPGVFYNPYMLIYEGVGNLNPDYSYHIKIHNTISGNQIEASTNLIENFTISKPPSGGKATFRRGFDTDFEWGNAEFAKRYEPGIRFHYFEVASGSNDTTAKYIDWILPMQTADDLSGNGSQEISVNNNGFYSFIENNIKPENYNGVRLTGTVDFFVTAAGVEFDTYMRVNGPSNSLVQDRPEYTNVENGYGLLSSRFNVSKNRRLHPEAEDEILLLGRSFVPNPNL